MLYAVPSPRPVNSYIVKYSTSFATVYDWLVKLKYPKSVLRQERKS